MKAILKSLFILCALVSVSTYASAQFKAFTSIAEAEKYCPSTNRLEFRKSSTQGTSGTITAVKDSKAFSTDRNNLLRPENIDADGFILGATFRTVGANNYGHISGPVTACFYWYTNFSGGQTAIVLDHNSLRG